MKDVTDLLNEPSSRIRYWLRFFGCEPKKRSRGNERRFSSRDIHNLLYIQHLIEVEQFTLNGAKTKFKDYERLSEERQREIIGSSTKGKILRNTQEEPEFKFSDYNEVGAGESGRNQSHD